VVDLAQAGRTARERVWAVRQGDAFRAEAARIVEKHASRKDGGAGRHFVNDRTPKRRKPVASDAQLRFDL
jgi:deoxyribodipyrimidine photo-lyase